LIVIPAQAGIQGVRRYLDPRLRGGDEGIRYFNGLLNPPGGPEKEFAPPADE